jgi:hypothetical protein
LRTAPTTPAPFPFLFLFRSQRSFPARRSRPREARLFTVITEIGYI